METIFNSSLKEETSLYIVQMVGITKTFPGVLANRAVDFFLRLGEIHALLGENGAGKTTLMNILSGLLQPNLGEIRINGVVANIKSPKDAIKYGIGMVHQRPLMVERLTVLENVLLGQKRGNHFFSNNSDEVKDLREISKKYGFNIDPLEEVWQLSAGEHQRIEILKALFHGARILILDEPTSVLTPKESELLFELLASMVKEKISVIYITHKLEEVISIADRATVMRRGKVMGTVDIPSTTVRDLASKMVGRDTLFQIKKQPATFGEKILEVRDLIVLDDTGNPAVTNVNFCIHRGEIFGIAGVSGSGQTELAETIAGLRTPFRGNLIIKEFLVKNFSPRGMIEKGISYLPEDLVKDGIASQLSIIENAVLKHHWKTKNFRRGIFKNDREVSSFVTNMIKDYDIHIPGLNANVGTLSGGNLRKLVLARELETRPDLLVVCQPTSGLDVAASEFVHSQLIEHSRRGNAILLISDNLDEIMQLSDTISVMHSGRMMSILPAQEAQIEEIGLMMGGAI